MLVFSDSNRDRCIVLLSNGCNSCWSECYVKLLSFCDILCMMSRQKYFLVLAISLIFRSLPGWWPNRLLLEVVSVRPSVRMSTKSFSDFTLIWYVGRPRLDICTSVTSTRSKVKVKVTELLKLQKLHFSGSISSTILAWSSKLMVGSDSMAPDLQLV